MFVRPAACLALVLLPLSAIAAEQRFSEFAPNHSGTQQAGVSATGIAVSVGTLADAGDVTLKGTVSEVSNDDRFALSDDSGTIRVYLAQAGRMKVGDQVTVSGRIASGSGEKRITDARVTVNGDAMPAPRG